MRSEPTHSIGSLGVPGLAGANRAEMLAGFLLRTVWLVVIPGSLAVLVARYLVPTPAEAQGTWAARLAELGFDHPLGLGLALFLGFAGVAHQWSDWLPKRGAIARRGTLALVAPIVLAAALAVVARGWLFGSYDVLSASMLPTLEPGDLVTGNRMAYGLHLGAMTGSPRRAPSRGDIVVFEPPPGVDAPGRLVKRVIGLPGDSISMNGPHPVINGWEVPSCDAGPYLYPVPPGGVAGRLAVEFLGDRAFLALYIPISDSWPETYVVKPGEVFLLGDYRGNSSDSRAWNDGKGGSLPFSAIEARVTWWLSGTHRDGRTDVDHLLKPLELNVRLDGLDTSVQRDGIQRCLAARPETRSRRRAMAPERRRSPYWILALALAATVAMGFAATRPHHAPLRDAPAPEAWFRSTTGAAVVLDVPAPAASR